MRAVPWLLIVLTVAGCASKRATVAPEPTTRVASQLTERTVNHDVQAYVVPPRDWRMDPLKSSGRHWHQVWVSPTGSTAYGVIRFSLPLPVGHEAALWAFMREMRKSEGEGVLIEKRWDENLDALRFVAEGGLYRVRTNLVVRGFTGWAVYAGSLRNRPVEQEELELAEQAREHTSLGLGDADRSDRR